MYVFLLLLVFSCKKENEVLTKEREVTSLPYFNSADFTPQWTKGTHRIPEFSFVNQNGKTISNKNYEGHIYVADFFFTTCPGICPKLTKNMNVLQEYYKNDSAILLLSHSVMPWVDTVDKLKEYEQNNQIDAKKWNLVTGDKKELYEIARKGYFADEDFKKTQDESEFIHTENFILVDKEGFIRGVYNGTLKFDLERLKRHIDILKKE